MIDFFSYFFKAFLIGFAIAVPIGPIGLICIRKALDIGFRGGFAAGIGIALADGIYALIACLGISAILEFFSQYNTFINYFGVISLLYIAYLEIVQKPSNTNLQVKTSDLLKIGLSSFLITASSPITIFSFLGVFASITIGKIGFSEITAMMSGIFLGSLVWWLILTLIIVKIRKKISNQWLVRIRYISAFVIAIFAFVLLYQV